LIKYCYIRDKKDHARDQSNATNMVLVVISRD